MKHKTKLLIHLTVLAVLSLLVYLTSFIMNRDGLSLLFMIFIVAMLPILGNAAKNYRDKQRKPMKTNFGGPGR